MYRKPAPWGDIRFNIMVVPHFEHGLTIAGMTARAEVKSGMILSLSGRAHYRTLSHRRPVFRFLSR
jgi:hypothetical protein